MTRIFPFLVGVVAAHLAIWLWKRLKAEREIYRKLFQLASVADEEFVYAPNPSLLEQEIMKLMDKHKWSYDWFGLTADRFKALTEGYIARKWEFERAKKRKDATHILETLRSGKSAAPDTDVAELRALLADGHLDLLSIRTSDRELNRLIEENALRLAKRVLIDIKQATRSSDPHEVRISISLLQQYLRMGHGTFEDIGSSREELVNILDRLFIGPYDINHAIS